VGSGCPADEVVTNSEAVQSHKVETDESEIAESVLIL
jgi:hypothetical protein